MTALKIIFVTIVILQGFHCLSFGNVTASSQIIFQGFFDHNGYEDQEATRQERITTDEDISAIRAIDVSGQNGEAVFSSYSPRSVVLVFSSDGAGRGFNFSVEVYANRNTDGDNGAGSKSISMIWIAISMVVGVISLTKF